jgi:hypothetical protein
LLLKSTPMTAEPGRWLKLNPFTIEEVPAAPGIFEIANLVRTILFIGAGEGNLRQKLVSLGFVPANLPASVGGYYVRYTLVADEAGAVAEREAGHRAGHGGRLPAGHEPILRPTIRLVTRHAA